MAAGSDRPPGGLRGGAGVRPGGRLALLVVAAVAAGWLAWAAGMPRPSGAEPRVAREHAVKLAYLFNLIRFTRWPEGALPPDGPFTLGVLGDDPFGPLLAELERRKLHERPVRVVRIRAPEQARECQALFVAASESQRLGAILHLLEGLPVLTFGDLTDFAARGGGVGFVRQGDRVRFEVNLGAIRKAGLRMSSEVLRLAARVLDPPRDKGEGDAKVP